jgi:hypothetical protein
VRFECDHGRKYTAKKIADPFQQRTSKSKRISCPFHINVRSPRSIAPHWHITTIVGNHNHALQPDVRFGRDLQKLTPEMNAKIKRYVQADLNLSRILTLLRQEFPEHYFDSRRVSNAIAKAKQGDHSGLSQAAQLLLMLQDRKSEDDRWFVRKDVDELTGRLRRVFWMGPEQRVIR